MLLNDAAVGLGERDRSEMAACERARQGFSEPNFTKAIATLLSYDEIAAAQFARAVVTTLRPAEADTVPLRLSCHAEASFYGRYTGPNRRADLVLASPQRDYLLLVEAKLGAGTGHDQVRDYILAKELWLGDEPGFRARRRRCRVALIGRKAIDSSDVSLLAGRFRHRDRWLGALTWLEVRDALADLEFQNGPSRLLWQSLLNTYAGPRGMGTEAPAGLSPEQLLSGVALALGRRNSPAGSIVAVPWSDRSNTIVRNGRVGVSAMMRVKQRRRGELIVVVEVADQRFVLELISKRRSTRATIPNEFRLDLARFDAWVRGEIARFGG